MYESAACDFLVSNGLKILDRNFRNRFGEIDIVAMDHGTFVFVEVKYRKTATAGYPEEAVNYKKARNICKVSDYYRLYKKIPSDNQIRFDVISIAGDKIRWHKNAFPYIN